MSGIALNTDLARTPPPVRPEHSTFVGTACGRAWIWIGFTKTPEGTRSTGEHWCETKAEAERLAGLWKLRRDAQADGMDPNEVLRMVEDFMHTWGED